MIHRFAALLLTVLAVLMVSAPSAMADPNTPVGGNLPQGFPAELKKFVAGTPEFKDAPWFHDPSCADKGGNVGMYINAVMADEPRLLYWSTPPDSRKQFWGATPLEQAQADPNKEPPSLPKLFPASAADRQAYALPVGAGACADAIREWTNPANNAFGFTWVTAPDPDTVELMKHQNATYPAELPIDQFTGACTADSKSPYCEKAFFTDCSRVAMNPDKHTACQHWDMSVAQLFAGMAAFIENNKSWLQQAEQFFGLVGAALYVGGRWVADAFSGIFTPLLTIAKYVADPASAVDDLANALHDAATTFTTMILQGLAAASNFDPTSPWFLATYAASTGIGLVVMAFMTIMTIWRAASGGGSREELQEALFRNLPLGVGLAVFSPAIGAVLTVLTWNLTDGIAAWDAGSLNGAVAKLSLISSVTAAAVPGGAILGIAIFGLMIFGAFAVFVGLAMQSIALPLSGAAAGIAWGMWVHPKFRRKALRVPMTYMGVALSKPLLFFMLGVIFRLIDGNLSEPAMKAGGIPLLTQLVLICVALLVAGFAPFSLLKYAPLLTTDVSSHDSQASSGFGTAAVVGAGVSALAGLDANASRNADGAKSRRGSHSVQQTYNAAQNGEQPQWPTRDQDANNPQWPARDQDKGTTGWPANDPDGGAHGWPTTDQDDNALGWPANDPDGASPEWPAVDHDDGPRGWPLNDPDGGAHDWPINDPDGGAVEPLAARGGGDADTRTPGSTGPSARTPSGAGKSGGGRAGVPGTTDGAAELGSQLGAIAGPLGVAAQAGVAGVNKARQAAHTHAPEVDDDVIRGDEK